MELMSQTPDTRVSRDIALVVTRNAFAARTDQTSDRINGVPSSPTFDAATTIATSGADNKILAGESMGRDRAMALVSFFKKKKTN
jgi:hypothetical protein